MDKTKTVDLSIGEAIKFERGFEMGVDGLEASNGIKIKDYHEQDWCEYVYADWSSLDDTTFYDTVFYKIQIEFIKNVGFRINGYLVNCYNCQNGYYSSGLDLIIEYPNGKKTIIDISEYVEDNID